MIRQALIWKLLVESLNAIAIAEKQRHLKSLGDNAYAVSPPREQSSWKLSSSAIMRDGEQRSWKFSCHTTPSVRSYLSEVFGQRSCIRSRNVRAFHSELRSVFVSFCRQDSITCEQVAYLCRWCRFGFSAFESFSKVACWCIVLLGYKLTGRPARAVRFSFTRSFTSNLSRVAVATERWSNMPLVNVIYSLSRTVAGPVATLVLIFYLLSCLSEYITFFSCIRTLSATSVALIGTIHSLVGYRPVRFL